MVLASSRIPIKNKENAYIKPCFKGGDAKGSVPRKRTHAQTTQPKTRLVPARAPESLCSLLKESCNLVDKLPKGLNALQHGKLKLPKTLRRPAFRAIMPESIAAADPELASVPLEYIQQGLRKRSEQLYNATLKIVPKQTDGALSNARMLEITVLEDSIELPTHALAVYSASNGNSQRQISLHPVHCIILASQCAHLPPVDPSPRDSSCSDPVALPILPMCIPNPRTFPLLLRYLYMNRTTEILSALLPLPTQGSSVAEISSKLAAKCNAPTLISLMSTAHGLWSNVAALGIFEDSLWEVIEFSWEVLLAALELKCKLSQSR